MTCINGPMPDGNGVPRQARWEFEQLSRKWNLSVKLVVYPPLNGLAPVLSHKLECKIDCVTPEDCDDHVIKIPAELIQQRIRERNLRMRSNAVAA